MLYDVPEEVVVEPMVRFGLSSPALAGLSPRLATSSTSGSESIECARRIAKLPSFAVQTTQRLLNIHVERAVMATTDVASAGEYESFATDDVRVLLECMALSGDSGGPTHPGREPT